MLAKRLVLCLAVLGSALLLMGTTVPPPDPPPSKVMWTKDGEYIILSTNFQGVFVVDIAGKHLWSIPRNAPIGDRDDPGNYGPALSPDGAQVLYVTFNKHDSMKKLKLEFNEDYEWKPINFIPIELLSPIFSALLTYPKITAAIETASVDGSEVRRLTVYKDLDGDGIIDRHTDVDPVWSPDGKKIAFKSNQSVYTEAENDPDVGLRLSIMNADGTDVRVLAPSVSLMASGMAADHPESRPPAWSPDGKWIAFVGWEKIEKKGEALRQRHVLYTVQPNGSGLTRIGETQKYGLLAWSPDGSLLAFVGLEVNEGGQNSDALYTVHPDGSGLTRISEILPDYEGYDLNNVRLASIDSLRIWSPDGAWLAYSRVDEEGSGIYVVRADGTDERLVLRGYGGPVSWSSDGTELYIEGMGFVVNPDGSNLRPLLGDNASAAEQLIFSSWSPDGSRLAVFAAPDSIRFDPMLYTVARDGTEKRVLIRGARRRLVAELSGWLESPRSVAACAEGSIVLDPIESPGLVEDCKTLLQARDSLIGDSYVNWSTVQPITAWDGVEVGCPSPLQVNRVTAWQGVEFWCPSPPRVIGLSLNMATGDIPSRIGNLSSLKKLDLSHSTLSGGIPPELGKLTSLRELRLDWSSIRGNIPPELGNLHSLRILSISHNYNLGGNIPPELGRLAKLEELNLPSNGLQGDIPPELGDLAKLKLLNLSGNGLTGSIPKEFGKLSNLKVLWLAVNALKGGIPPELGKLSNLKVLGLSVNNLTGTIPPELGNLAELEDMYIIANSLSGSIPPQLGQLKSLQALSVASNELSGPLPSELGSLSSLWALDISGNSLSGCIPIALSQQLKVLESDDLAYCE